MNKIMEQFIEQFPAAAEIEQYLTPDSERKVLYSDQFVYEGGFFPAFHYHYFREIDFYAFRNICQHKEYKDIMVQKPGEFKPVLSVHETMSFEVSGEFATPVLYYFLKRMLTNYTTHPCYKIHQAAGAFFQGGYDNPDGQWFLIEFWNPKGVKEFMDYLNANYNPNEDISWLR